jgi:sugar phosphate isomerase/epimerase
MLGNSGAPRWYDCDQDRFLDYLDLIVECGARATEIVLHDGDADEYTSRVHVLRPDWDAIFQGYRKRELSVFVHGPLTPEFSANAWIEDRSAVLRRYDSILRQVAEIAREQGSTTLILHAATAPDSSLSSNEAHTASFLTDLADALFGLTDRARIAIELRAFRASRRTAAAATRDSVLRVVQELDHPDVGICWDVAHDFETSIATRSPWTMPDEEFMRRVIHIHIHDIGHDGEPHCPPLLGRVPIAKSLRAAPGVPAIMEIRWRMAERMGDPWSVLAKSYRAVLTGDSGSGAARSSNRS